MKTYSTYQADKIANPDSEIKTDNLGNFFVPVGHTTCNPDDYCMTVKQFLDAGHKFVDGDFMLGQDGLVVGVSNCPSYNMPFEDDDKRYALSAKALEETNTIPTETPEEKEALDAIEKTYRYEKVEFEKASDAVIAFENGDELHTHFITQGFVSVEAIQQVVPNWQANKLYRRIEVTERELFIEESCKIVGASIDSDAANDFGKQFDSGKFKLVKGE